MPDAEALLFVDDEEPQILEVHVFLEQAVGADDDVHRSSRHALQHRLLFRSGPEPAEALHLDAEVFKPLPEGIVVLFGQNGGGHQDRHLFAVGRPRWL